MDHSSLQSFNLLSYRDAATDGNCPFSVNENESEVAGNDKYISSKQAQFRASAKLGGGKGQCRSEHNSGGRSKIIDDDEEGEEDEQQLND
jgi:hypothetical protein